MGQSIRCPIQICFGMSCICWAYFLHNSTDFHDMLTESQRIKSSHSFLTVLLICHTYRFNCKYSLLKLLCTLARLCEGTPFQPLRLDFFWINFSSHPRSQLSFLTFSGQAGQHNKGKGAQSPWARPAPQPSHTIYIAPPPTYHVSPTKLISTLHRAISHRCTPLEECFPCVARNIFSVYPTCPYLWYFRKSPRFITPPWCGDAPYGIPICYGGIPVRPLDGCLRLLLRLSLRLGRKEYLLLLISLPHR